jgi:hypothetical protein
MDKSVATQSALHICPPCLNLKRPPTEAVTSDNTDAYGTALKRREAGTFCLMNDTLTLRFAELPGSDDRVEGLKQIQQEPSSGRAFNSPFPTCGSDER